MKTAETKILEQLQRAFQLGYAARGNGRRLSTNPYAFDSAQRPYWASGWRQCERELSDEMGARYSATVPVSQEVA